MRSSSVNVVRPANRLVLGQGLAILSMLLLVACAARLAWIAQYKAEKLRAQAERQQKSKTTYLARRGSIYDSNPVSPRLHNTLAVSYMLDSVYVDPKLLGDVHTREAIICDLARMLKPGPADLTKLVCHAFELNDLVDWPTRRRIVNGLVKACLLDSDSQRFLEYHIEDFCKARGTTAPDDEPVGPAIPSDDPRPSAPGSRFVWVKRCVEVDQSRDVRQLIEKKKYKGIGLMPELVRVYPNGQLASHQIGFLGKDGEPKEGLEWQYDYRVDPKDPNRLLPLLRGTDGYKEVVATARRQPLWSAERAFLEPRDGKSLVLNINAVIQDSVERVLADTVKKYAYPETGTHADPENQTSGVAIVMDVNTGAVLAIANYPTYSLEEKDRPADDPRRRNRALTDPFEPGSIFKWVVVAGALERKVVTPDEIIHCAGPYQVAGGRTVHEAHDHYYGDLPVTMVVAKSSNVGMSHIGEKMGKEKLYATLMDFGLGHKTGIELTDVENSGDVHPLREWKVGYSVESISFGQEITVTPIQVVTAFCAICNGGYLPRPRLVSAIIDDSAVSVGGAPRVLENFMPADPNKPAGRRIISPATSRTMIQILRTAVEKGTGQKAESDRLYAGEHLEIFGKTGTAQIYHRGHDAHDRGSDTGDFTASFICGAPVKSPRIAVLVAIRKPNKGIAHFGGTVAAPAAKQIVEETLAWFEAWEKSERRAP